MCLVNGDLDGGEARAWTGARMRRRDRPVHDKPPDQGEITSVGAALGWIDLRAGQRGSPSLHEVRLPARNRRANRSGTRISWAAMTASASASQRAPSAPPWISPRRLYRGGVAARSSRGPRPRGPPMIRPGRLVHPATSRPVARRLTRQCMTSTTRTSARRCIWLVCDSLRAMDHTATTWLGCASRSPRSRRPVTAARTRASRLHRCVSSIGLFHG